MLKTKIIGLPVLLAVGMIAGCNTVYEKSSAPDEHEVIQSKYRFDEGENNNFVYKKSSNNWYLGNSPGMKQVLADGGVVVIRKVDSTQQGVNLSNFQKLNKEKEDLVKLKSEIKEIADQVKAEKEIIASMPVMKSESQTSYSVFFSSGSSSLDKKQQKGLYDFMQANANPSDCNERIKVEIIGFSDSDGKANYNMKLSENRAMSVLKYIRSIQQFSDLEIEVKAKGETLNIADNETSANKAKNRRAEIVVTKIKEERRNAVKEENSNCTE